MLKGKSLFFLTRMLRHCEFFLFRANLERRLKKQSVMHVFDALSGSGDKIDMCWSPVPIGPTWLKNSAF